MPANLALDDRLIEQARMLGRHRTKKKPSPPPSTNTFSAANSGKFFPFSLRPTTAPPATISTSAARNALERPSGC